MELKVAGSLVTRPRQIIPQLMKESSRRSYLILVSLFGVSVAFDMASSLLLGDLLPLLIIVAGAICIGPLIGVIYWFIMSFLLGISARLLGGEVDQEETRQLVAIASIPAIFKLVITVICILFFGSEIFTNSTAIAESSILLMVIYMVTFVAKLVLIFFYYFTLIQGCSEIHQMTTGKALGAVILSMIGLIAISVFVNLILNILI
ncbi:YIP1 family protein [Hazenella coriacea]|uniref:Yip1-like protein n=1 Tax=Hazenella coriacea TaxID=1179467 RepID=A0A4R3L4I0_9BACL|nr:YIP1 family protein [Hazenella coriacea]TCS94681.1 Yip1-like protein [Hazenella coriacea]